MPTLIPLEYQTTGRDEASAAGRIRAAALAWGAATLLSAVVGAIEDALYGEALRRSVYLLATAIAGILLTLAALSAIRGGDGRRRLPVVLAIAGAALFIGVWAWDVGLMISRPAHPASVIALQSVMVLLLCAFPAVFACSLLWPAWFTARRLIGLALASAILAMLRPGYSLWHVFGRSQGFSDLVEGPNLHMPVELLTMLAAALLLGLALFRPGMRGGRWLPVVATWLVVGVAVSGALAVHVLWWERLNFPRYFSGIQRPLMGISWLLSALLMFWLLLLFPRPIAPASSESG